MRLLARPRPRVAVTGIFFLNGAVFSGWYARLPAIQEGLELSPGELGIALLGAPLGLLVAQPAVGAVAARTGSRPIVAAAPLYLASLGSKAPRTSAHSGKRATAIAGVPRRLTAR